MGFYFYPEINGTTNRFMKFPFGPFIYTRTYKYDEIDLIGAAKKANIGFHIFWGRPSLN